MEGLVPQSRGSVISAQLTATRYEVKDRVAIVTLSRPRQMNAWTPVMELETRRLMGRAEADPSVHAVVLTGEGKAFCAGGDQGGVSRLGNNSFDEGIEPDDLHEVGIDAPPALQGRLSYLLGMDKPVVAAVNGPAMGVGFVLMCFCDVRIASPDVKLSMSFARFGLPAEHGAAWILPRLVGMSRAVEWLLSARVLEAAETAGSGLFVDLTDPSKVLEASIDYAGKLASQCSPVALRTIKRQLYSDSPLRTGSNQAHRSMLELVVGPDLKEGVSAYAEKRSPNFEGPRSRDGN
jgi:enoyl-CoA hydratase/carnithine racemase